MHNLPLIIIALLIPSLAIVIKVGLGIQFFLNISLYIVATYLSLFQDFSYLSLITIFHAIWVVCTAD